jgi:hypothetical protein
VKLVKAVIAFAEALSSFSVAVGTQFVFSGLECGFCMLPEAERSLPKQFLLSGHFIILWRIE